MAASISSPRQIPSPVLVNPAAMAREEPIPVPGRIWWREFRVRLLMPLLFLAGLAGVVFLWPMDEAQADWHGLRRVPTVEPHSSVVSND
jgi:hypothetical protein